MKTHGGFMAECADCGVTRRFDTQLQRKVWVAKEHVGHAIWLWREKRKVAT